MNIIMCRRFAIQLAVLFNLFATSVAHAVEINDFNIDGFKLRQTVDQLKGRYPCSQSFKVDYPSKGLTECEVSTYRNGIASEGITILFGVTGEVMQVKKVLSTTSESQLAYIKNILLQDRGVPDISSRFIVGDVPYDAYCWGDCTVAGNSFRVGVNYGASYVINIKNTIRTQITIQLEDRELYQKFWAWQKSNK